MTVKHHNDGQRLLGYLLVAAGASLWGTLGIVGRVLYGSGLTPGVVVTLRAVVTAAVLLVTLAVLRPAWLSIRLRDVPYFAAYGLVSVAAYNLLYFLTIQRISVAGAAVLLYTAPVFVAVVAYLTLGEPLTRHKLTALVLTLVGCALVARAYKPETFKVQGLGLLTGLGAGFAYGMYGIFGKHGLKRYNPWVLQAYSLLTGSAALLLLYGREAAQAVVKSPQLLPIIAYLSLVPTLGAYGLYLTGLQFIESSHASILATVELVVAALLGYLVLGEPLNLPQVAGTVLVLAGAVILHAGSSASTSQPLPGNKGRK